MVAATTTTPPATLRTIDLGLLDESKTNPRKTFTAIDDLAADLKVRGLLQPVLARPRGARFELVFGHRRLRAAKLAKLEAIPAIVRDMGDQEVLETQLVENAKREDIHPLEEAEGYERLHKEHKLSVDEIAAKVGKSKAAIYARMKLLALCPAARAAFYEGSLTPSTALLVARIPHADLQKDALKELLPSTYRPEPASVRTAFDIIERKYMLRLAEAPFDRKDAELVAGTGACTTCPKRTGNQAELFSDVKSADVCTDPKCFAEKRDATWKKKAAAAKAAGGEVIEGKAAKALFPYAGAGLSSNTHVDLDAHAWVDGKNVRYRDLLRKSKAEIPVALARDPRGGIHELVPRNAVAKLLPKEPSASTAAVDKKWKEQKAKREAEEATRPHVVAAVVAAAEKREMTDTVLRLIGQGIVSALSYDLDDVAVRRGLKKAGDHAKYPDKLLEAQVASSKGEKLRGLIVELAVHDDRELLDAACEFYKVDRKAIEKKATAPAAKVATDKTKKKGKTR